MKIAVIGAGISGLTTAYLLQHDHDIHVFETNDYIGGHTNTIRVNEAGRALGIDTGFIVFNSHNYPNLCRLFTQLGISGRRSDMSFSVHNEQTGLEYNGSGLNRLFCQRSNIIRPRFWKMLADILRFHKQAPQLLHNGMDDSLTVREFIEQNHYSRQFIDEYLVPLGASLWSAPTHRFRGFPMRFVLEFLDNHRMLQMQGRPQWQTVAGGSNQYVAPLINGFADRIRLHTPVVRVRRVNKGTEVALKDGRSETFDELILATHADQSLKLLDAPDPMERETLARFPYQDNEAILHTDTSVLPDRRTAWASWNYRIPAVDKPHVSVTYNMNMLQGLDSDKTYCVSLNQSEGIDESQIIRRIHYHHPVFQPGRASAQAGHAALIRRRGISYCGAYWGFGFHEDGVNSALAVCAAYDRGLD